MDNFQIRSEARRLLSGKWWMLALVWLLYWLLNSVSGVNLIVGGPLTLGVSALFLKINRGQDFQLEEMFSGFNDFWPRPDCLPADPDLCAAVVFAADRAWHHRRHQLFHDLFHHG